MIIQHVAFCQRCENVWLVPSEIGNDGYAGVLEGRAGHMKNAPECRGEYQLMKDKLSQMPAWVQEKAGKLLAKFHWSETSEGYDLWTEAFQLAELAEVDKTDLEPETYTNAEIARKCDDYITLMFCLMELPRDDDLKSARRILSRIVDEYQL